MPDHARSFPVFLMLQTTIHYTRFFDALKSIIFFSDFTMFLTHFAKVMTVQVADGTSESPVSNRRTLWPEYIYLCTDLYTSYMGVSINGVTPKSMAYNGKSN